MNIWNKLKKPIICLAPMAGATDTVFRQIVTDLGKPDLMMTEFLCVDQLYSPGSKAIQQLLEYAEKERPIIAQIWGVTPELFHNAAQMIVEFGFDGVDLNMGCPEKSVIKRGACSALIKDPMLAGEIIQATKEGVAGKIPVSVKTRIGFDEIVTEEWSRFLLSQKIDALIVHGRTTKELSKVECHWNEIGKVVKMRNEMGVDTPIIGNGDVLNLEDAEGKIKKYKVDGIMIGRGVFKDPWVFNEKHDISMTSPKEKVKLMKKHIALYQDIWGEEKNYSELKRFYKIYVNGFPGAAKIREKLMKTENFEGVLSLIEKDLLPNLS
ncbi:tRNA dihydrouridine synthase [Patescibacteria group bacterium]